MDLARSIADLRCSAVAGTGLSYCASQGGTAREQPRAVRVVRSSAGLPTDPAKPNQHQDHEQHDQEHQLSSGGCGEGVVDLVAQRGEESAASVSDSYAGRLRASAPRAGALRARRTEPQGELPSHTRRGRAGCEKRETHTAFPVVGMEMYSVHPKTKYRALSTVTNSTARPHCQFRPAGKEGPLSLPGLVCAGVARRSGPPRRQDCGRVEGPESNGQVVPTGSVSLFQPCSGVQQSVWQQGEVPGRCVFNQETPICGYRPQRPSSSASLARLPPRQTSVAWPEQCKVRSRWKAFCTHQTRRSVAESGLDHADAALSVDSLSFGNSLSSGIMCACHLQI
ncbi:hypothetical protein ACVWXU_008619 [Streptomyces sp. TE33382]